MYSVPYKIPSYNLPIGIKEKKDETISAALKVTALEYILNNYPNEQWLHISTDVSAKLNSTSGAVSFLLWKCLWSLLLCGWERY